MSVSVDDKLLGEKSHYYCSSSEDEEEENKPDPSEEAPNNQNKYNQGRAVNTGPKGVIEDWRKFKQLETEQRESELAQKQELVKKLSMTCSSYLNDEDKKKDEDEELEDLADEFLREYREQRLAEMRNLFQNVLTFGKVLNLTAKEFTTAVDSEKAHVMVIVHVYTEDDQACESMNGCLSCLAQEYPTVKFCKIKAADAMLSGNFAENGVPALLIYRNKELIGNFVRLSDEFGEDFFATDVESYLIEHGFLPCQDTATRTDKPSAQDDSDSDFGVD